jgi:hypothetical protein
VKLLADPALLTGPGFGRGFPVHALCEPSCRGSERPGDPGRYLGYPGDLSPHESVLAGPCRALGRALVIVATLGPGWPVGCFGCFGCFFRGKPQVLSEASQGPVKFA